MDRILVLDFGGQYNQLIARRVREQHVYAEIRPFDGIDTAEIVREGYSGIILTGGPNSVYDPKSPHYDPSLLDAGIPLDRIHKSGLTLQHRCGILRARDLHDI